MNAPVHKVILWGYDPQSGTRHFGTVRQTYKAENAREPKPSLVLLESELSIEKATDTRQNFKLVMSKCLSSKRWPEVEGITVFLQVDITLFKIHAQAILPSNLEIKFDALDDLRLRAGLIYNTGSTTFNPELAALIAFIEAFGPK